MNLDAKQAIASANLADLKKQANAATWNNNMENLIKSWGEKAAGLRYMHQDSSGKWKKFSNNLALWSIAITTFTSAVSLAAASIADPESKNAVLYAVGGIGVISTGLQSIKKFYNAEEKAADHNTVARQFGTFYRYITLQLTLTPSDRLPSDQLSEYCLKEYERLQQEAPNIAGSSVKVFKENFKESNQAIPDICEEDFSINVYKKSDSGILDKKLKLDNRFAPQNLKENAIELRIAEE